MVVAVRIRFISQLELFNNFLKISINYLKTYSGVQIIYIR